VIKLPVKSAPDEGRDVFWRKLEMSLRALMPRGGIWVSFAKERGCRALTTVQAVLRTSLHISGAPLLNKVLINL